MQLRKSTPRKKIFDVCRDVCRASLALHAAFVLTILVSASISIAQEATSKAGEVKVADQVASQPTAAAPASEAETTASEAKESSKKKSTHRWSDHESRLTSLMTKIRSFEKEIADMIESKQRIENSEQVRILTQQIAFKYSDLAKVIKEYEAERLHVRFQHPDRDSELEREYRTHRLKSLDEIETAFGLDGRLDRIRRQVGIVFPSSDGKPAIKVRRPANVEVQTDESDMPGSIHLVK